MALQHIAASGLRAHERLLENTAHNVSQLNVRDAWQVRTDFVAEAPPPAGPGGVRAETHLAPRVSRPAFNAPLLDPNLEESFVRDDIDLVQEQTNAIVARRGFEVSLAVQRSATAFIEATLNITA